MLDILANLPCAVPPLNPNDIGTWLAYVLRNCL